MPSNQVTLKKGTWFYFRHDNEAKLGEIIDFAKDEERPDLYWFQCTLHYDLQVNQEIDENKLLSSRNFEQFRELDLMTEEDGENALERLIERDRERRQQEQEQESPERPTRERPTRAVESEESEPEDTDSEDAAEPERDYISSQMFRPTHGSLNILSSNFKTPLGSGDMKSILKIYEADSDRSWQAVDTMIEQTGHLLLTYTNAATRRSIINHKVDYLASHDWQELEVRALYELTYGNLITKAIYLGGNHWMTKPYDHNAIDGLEGKILIAIGVNEIKDFRVARIEDNEIRDFILDSIDGIRPSDLTHLAGVEDKRIYCQTSADASIEKKEISKNWEKAFTYNYYLGEDLDLRLPVSEFNDREAIEKLATAREDTAVLEVL